VKTWGAILPVRAFRKVRVRLRSSILAGRGAIAFCVTKLLVKLHYVDCLLIVDRPTG
jgi:hypothetical protein